MAAGRYRLGADSPRPVNGFAVLQRLEPKEALAAGDLRDAQT